MTGKSLVICGLLALGPLSAQARQRVSGQELASQATPVRDEVRKSLVKMPATEDPSYVIGPQDVLNISVWREPEITRTLPVRPDGKISLPLLNDVQAAGLTPMQLGTIITGRLRKYMADPQVTVMVAEVNSQRVYLLGEVTRAGAYPLLPGMTVLQALSSAGGLTEFAKRTKLYILRTESGKQVKVPFDYKKVVAGRQQRGDIALQAGDTIVVP